MVVAACDLDPAGASELDAIARIDISEVTAPLVIAAVVDLDRIAQSAGLMTALAKEITHGQLVHLEGGHAPGEVIHQGVRQGVGRAVHDRAHLLFGDGPLRGRGLLPVLHHPWAGIGQEAGRHDCLQHLNRFLLFLGVLVETEEVREIDLGHQGVVVSLMVATP